MTQAEAEKFRITLESSDVPKEEMFPGFFRQTLVYGKELMLCLFTLKKGTNLPPHSHYHEQAGFVISGKVELWVEGEKYITGPGCSYFIPSGYSHTANAIEDALVVDAFSPPREEYRREGE